ncbi:MAG TPA: ATP-binding protein [Candidatus Saccharimonadales bacterium]|nr:ATP-binding protein [Candidatus Saccharimonadales bacterium]
MQDFYLIINWVVAIAMLGLGFAALLKNHRLTLNKFFALFTVAIAVWIIASVLSNDMHNTQRFSVIGNYFVFFFSFLASYLLLWFAVALAKDAKAARHLRRCTIPILLVAIVSGTPLVVSHVHKQGEVYAVDFGPLAVLYGLGLVVLLGSTLIVLHRNAKRTTGEDRAHLSVVYRSMVVALPIIVATDFILPAATGWFGLTNIAILFMAIPTVGLYYSVVRFRLFNIRFIIVRSMAYVLTLGIVAVTYGSISYYLASFLSNKNEATQVILNVALIAIAVTIYPPLIRLFRRITNKLFYRDAYDPQEVFDQLNRVLVSTLDLDKLLGAVSVIVADNMRTQFCTFLLAGTPYRKQRIINGQRSTDGLSFDTIQRQVAHVGSSIIVVDYLDAQNLELKRHMDENDVSIVIQLVQKQGGVSEELGYMLLGSKKSGSAYGSQDLRVLDTVANELVIAIQNALHFEEIQNFNKTLQQQVNDATSKLRRTNHKLKALDETKDEFITMASHQLRTPLTSVKGYLSMVLEGDAGKLNKQQEQLLTQSFISSQRMVYLIADLLNLSRLNTGKFVIEPIPVDLREVVQGEIDQLRETAKARNLTLAYDRPAEFPLLMLDETKIHQVVMNFIDNAIYYTPSGGTIRIELHDNPSNVEYLVIDNGIGVPKREQPHLFTKFYRAGNARKARPDGTGLGLFMAKKVIAAQDGIIVFQSEEGKGSTFGFRFAKSRHLAPGETGDEPSAKALAKSTKSLR